MTAVAKRTRHFATFMAPGLIVGNQWDMELASEDPQKVHWPDDAYAFTLHRREDVTVDGAEYQGKREQVGPIYYHPDSVVQTLEEAKANPKATPVLISNMECNDWGSVVWTRWGNWPQPFDPAEIQVLPKGGAA